ncbi:MAG: protein-glutamate O-methyltransferase CheR, partial [Magnetospirillum sp.]|nr:protein-glutamate O-methyltransferase CheR [Magnetospirillum sp.]
MILDLKPFKDLVRTRCGLMLEGNGEETLKGALAARMHALGCATARTYLSRLGGDSAEFQELVTLLTINETYFFREPEQLALLTDKLVPRYQGLRGGTPLRILSAGCSTGEEPYSIAMALLDRLGESMAAQVHLVGGDIDHLALAKARAAHYSAFSFRGLSAERRERYFSPIGRHGFALADCVRSKVRFHHLNLLSPEIAADLADFDIVLFRNVSIYFDTPTREAILRNLSARMKPDALLLVGSAETLANDLGVFRLVEEDGLFFFTKTKAPCAARPTTRVATKPAAPVAAKAVVSPPVRSVSQAVSVPRQAPVASGLDAAR